MSNPSLVGATYYAFQNRSDCDSIQQLKPASGYLTELVADKLCRRAYRERRFSGWAICASRFIPPRLRKDKVGRLIGSWPHKVE
jgi:hypothetical protein